MKRIALIVFCISISVMGQKADKSTIITPKASKIAAFSSGEYLKYRVHYGFIDAGYAELEVDSKTRKYGKDVLHIKGFGRSTGLVELTFKTRDYYETYFDPEGLVPVEFVRDVDEGGYKTKRHLIFDHDQQKVKDLELKTDTLFRIKRGMQDLFSSFYYARSLDASNLKKGDKIPIDIFLDHEDFAMQLEYLGKETVKSEFGKIRCMKFRPIVQDGRVFKEEDSVEIWISDDDNKIPIMVKSKIFVGSIKMELIEYKNLSNKISFQ